MSRPTPQQIRLMAARAFMPERKVREVYAGRSVRESTYLRVLQAALDSAAPVPPLVDQVPGRHADLQYRDGRFPDAAVDRAKREGVSASLIGNSEQCEVDRVLDGPCGSPSK